MSPSLIMTYKTNIIQYLKKNPNSSLYTVSMIFFIFLWNRFLSYKYLISSKLLSVPTFWEFLFQKSKTFLFFLVEWFHNVHLLSTLMSIIWLVIHILILTKLFNFFHKNFTHGATLEFWWTLAPLLVLFTIAIPSLFILYLNEENYTTPFASIKCLGHQWFWTYELITSKLPNFYSFLQNDLTFPHSMKNSFIESFMNDEMTNRLLNVSDSLILKSKMNYRVLISSADVIHSWATPSMNIKIDALPGRMNQIDIYNDTEGVFYGQCSELCGANHAFMPIKIIFNKS